MITAGGIAMEVAAHVHRLDLPLLQIVDPFLIRLPDLHRGMRQRLAVAIRHAAVNEKLAARSFAAIVSPSASEGASWR